MGIGNKFKPDDDGLCFLKPVHPGKRLSADDLSGIGNGIDNAAVYSSVCSDTQLGFLWFVLDAGACHFL